MTGRVAVCGQFEYLKSRWMAISITEIVAGCRGILPSLSMNLHDPECVPQGTISYLPSSSPTFDDNNTGSRHR